MKKLSIFGGEFAIIDDEDFPVLSRLSWHSSTSKVKGIRKDKFGVYHLLENKHNVSLHYFLLPKIGSGKFRCVHKNGNNFDFRKENIEWRRIGIITHTARKANGATSKYKGVHYEKETGYFRAYITRNRRRFWLGRFQNENDAAKAFNKKSKELYGEFAYQNVIK